MNDLIASTLLVDYVGELVGFCDSRMMENEVDI